MNLCEESSWLITKCTLCGQFRDWKKHKPCFLIKLFFQTCGACSYLLLFASCKNPSFVSLPRILIEKPPPSQQHLAGIFIWLSLTPEPQLDAFNKAFFLNFFFNHHAEFLLLNSFCCSDLASLVGEWCLKICCESTMLHTSVVCSVFPSTELAGRLGRELLHYPCMQLPWQ